MVRTVTATRAATEDDLLARALPRIDQLIASGATTIEVKSGYGLSIADEVKLLRAARRIATARPVTVRTTHLAAHAVPPDYKGRAMAYITDVAIPSLRAAQAEGLVDAVDAFCETIAFSPDDLAPLFAQARALAGLPDAVLGVAPHSLRAVSRATLDRVAGMTTGPIHIHIAEQLAEVAEVQAAWGARPVDWALANLALDARWCMIHATQMTPAETTALARTGAVAGLCPITEANLGDGIFDAPGWLPPGPWR